MKTVIWNDYGQDTLTNLNSIPPTGTILRVQFPEDQYAQELRIREVIVICSEDSAEMEIRTDTI